MGAEIVGSSGFLCRCPRSALNPVQDELPDQHLHACLKTTSSLWVFLAILMTSTGVIWCDVPSRGTPWARKTPATFSGSWWRSARSAASPGRCATRRGWTTSCSCLWPWRQQLTKVKEKSALSDPGVCPETSTSTGSPLSWTVKQFGKTSSL